MDTAVTDDVTSLHRFRAQRDLARIRHRLAELATDPVKPGGMTLREVLLAKDDDTNGMDER